MRTSDFTYELPASSIAQSPAEPRDSSRLLDTSTATDHVFSDLPGLLEPGDLVVVNDTRVRAARLRGNKVDGGGAVEVLLLEGRPDATWNALVKPARRLRAGSRVRIGEIVAELVSDPVDGMAQLALEASDGDVEAAITCHGEMPLPPYITTRLDDPERYQTMFATVIGSAAAPTAGLHFTPAVVEGLRARGVGLARVELRIGLATFRPISTELLEDHEMHAEWLSVPAGTAASIAATRARGGSVVAIGTTVVRALESRAGDRGGVLPGIGDTDLFITPGYEFSVVDRLVTNFHLPRSSLVCMVEAFMGDSWRAAYRTALDREYRFLSFGDAMLAERHIP